MEGEERIENLVFGRERYEHLKRALSRLRLQDFFGDDGELRDLVGINRNLGLDINWAEYFRLRPALERIRGRFMIEEGIDEALDLGEYVCSKKKGCKKFRKILVGRRSRIYRENDPSVIASAVTLWGGGIEYMGRSLVELNFSMWKLNKLEAGFKNFMFKLVQGRLYLNQALSHFTDVTPQCTFCQIEERGKMIRENIARDGRIWNDRLNRLRHESILHLFWECPLVKKVVNEVGNRLSGTIGRSFTKIKWLGGLKDYSTKNMQMSILLVHFIKYYVYLSRCRKKIPNAPQCMYELGHFLQCIGRGEKWREQIEDTPELTARMME